MGANIILGRILLGYASKPMSVSFLDCAASRLAGEMTGSEEKYSDEHRGILLDQLIDCAKHMMEVGNMFFFLVLIIL